MKQEIRIIGGLYRGKKLQFPLVEGLRPTADRIKETLFNWLMHEIKEARCLDAFSGSGSLGFEAFSRGAKQVVFVEYSVAAQHNLKKILTQFNSPKLTLVKADTRTYLQHCTQQFDIIFLDPPFKQDLIPQCLSLIIKNNLLPTGGVLYIEAPAIIDLDAEHWKPRKLKQSGQVVYGLYEKL